MEIYTFKHKITNEIIKFDHLELDDDIGRQYYFIESKTQPPWFSFERKNLEYIQNCREISAIKSMYCNCPNTDSINIHDYEIVKFILSDLNFI